MIENVNSAIEILEAINPREKDAYEKAILAYLTIKKLLVLIRKIPAETPIFRSRTHEINDYFKTIGDISITLSLQIFGKCNL
jgi:hypothetical protein